MGIRTTIQEQVIDRGQFAIDRGLRSDYQPMPWVGIDSGSRAGGTAERWTLMHPELVRLAPASAVDIGCNVGFFALSMAEEGIAALGIESERRFLRLAQHAARKGRIRNVSFLDAHLTPDSIWQVPTADVVLLLSVHHHWVRAFGVDAARDMLAQIWSRASIGLFFDTGESELPERFGAEPMGEDPQGHLQRYLEEACGGSRVKCLGTSRAFVPGRGDERTAPALRHLFLVERE